MIHNIRPHAYTQDSIFECTRAVGDTAIGKLNIASRSNAVILA